MQDIELVYHLAAKINVDESILYPQRYTENNIEGTRTILDAVRKHNPDMVMASTCEAYGANLSGTEAVLEAVRKYNAHLVTVSTAGVYKGSKGRMDENHPLNPQSPYAASKAGADRLCYAYHKTYGIKVKIVRPFNIFGPRQKREGFGAVIPIFYEKALNNEKLPIKGDGKQTRDYLYVSDVVDAYRLIAETDELNGHAVNVGSGLETSINHVAKTVLYFTKRPYHMIEHIGERAGEVDSFIADTTLIEQYGFKPKVDFDTGMKNYYNWRVGLDEDSRA